MSWCHYALEKHHHYSECLVLSSHWQMRAIYCITFWCDLTKCIYLFQCQKLAGSVCKCQTETHCWYRYKASDFYCKFCCCFHATPFFLSSKYGRNDFFGSIKIFNHWIAGNHIPNFNKNETRSSKGHKYILICFCKMSSIFFSHQCANSSGYKHGITQDNKVNVIFADAVAPYVARVWRY